MNSYFVAIFVLLGASLVVATKVEKCKTGLPLPISVEVSGCDVPPCKFIKGKDIIAHVNFESPSDIESLHPKVHVEALNFELDYPLPEKEGCDVLVGDDECPLEEGQTATYELRMPILSIYPQIGLNFELTLNDASGDKDVPFACFRVAGQVTSA